MVKKSAFWCLLLICCSCIAFTGGFYLGRNLNRTPVQVDTLPPVAATNFSEGTGEKEPESININTATIEQLQTLPKVGPVLAQRILEHRQIHGPFENVRDIANVEGIGDSILEAILPYITVGG